MHIRLLQFYQIAFVRFFLFEFTENFHWLLLDENI